ITLWIATQTIGLHTQLAANAGALKAGGQVASLDQGGSPITWLEDATQSLPGTILAATKQGIQVATGKGILNLLSLQPAGKKAM
ncbi:hypothetical protein MJL33_33255, partial [Salmonella enterica subsp. enterica serovar Kentucky]|nr:hypothetical protein [Salmonella enterica subsp. enterica serovar Kentucky]